MTKSRASGAFAWQLARSCTVSPRKWLLCHAGDKPAPPARVSSSLLGTSGVCGGVTQMSVAAGWPRGRSHGVMEGGFLASRLGEASGGF